MNERREQKMRRVLAHRQRGLTVVLENITDPHNISAVLRSCDAVGIAQVHLIGTYEPYGRHLGSHSSASAFQWVDVQTYQDRQSCMETLGKQGLKIMAALPEKSCSSLYELDLCQPMALVFGNEQNGVSEEVRSYCNGCFSIPQMGMLPSLNISVACAVSLYEALRQRMQRGHYHEAQLSSEEQEDIFRAWEGRDLYRKGRR